MENLPWKIEPIDESSGLHFIPTANHLCSFYSNETEYVQSLRAFISYGHRLKAKIIYIVSPTQLPKLQTYLSDLTAALDIPLKEKQWTIYSFADFYLLPDNLNEQKIMEKIKLEHATGQQSGFDQLFIVTDMIWILAHNSPLPAAAIYGEIIDKITYSEKLPCTALCQYNTQVFPSPLLNQVIDIHPLYLLNDKFEKNHFYTSHSGILRKGMDKKNLSHQLKPHLDNHQSKEFLHRLREQNEEMIEFCYRFTHDLKSHIRSAHFFNFLILQEYAETVSPEVRDYLQKMSQSLHKAFFHIDSLNLILQATKLQENWELIDLNKVINNTIESFKSLIERVAGHIQYRSCPQNAIRGDISQITQIFKCIFADFLKLHNSRAPFEIFVTCEIVLKRTIKVTITDNNQDLYTLYKEKVIQSHYRLDEQKNSGYGIELPICQKIIERHKGSLSVHSEEGIGTTVTLIFPIEPTPGKEA